MIKLLRYYYNRIFRKKQLEEIGYHQQLKSNEIQISRLEKEVKFQKQQNRLLQVDIGLLKNKENKS